MKTFKITACRRSFLSEVRQIATLTATTTGEAIAEARRNMIADRSFTVFCPETIRAEAI